MINLTKEELGNFTPTNNMVLLEPVIDTSKVTFGEMELKLDTSFHPENHVRVINRIVSLPKCLKFSMNVNKYRSMEWETEMELKYGDIVWINYLAGLKATQIQVDEKYYILLPYSQIYLAKREKEIKTFKKIKETVLMLNGYVIVESIKEKIQSVIDIPDKENMRVMRIVNLGRPNKRYKEISVFDDDYLRVNDRVVMKNVHHRKLEYDIHARFEKKYYITQRPRILGVLGKRTIFQHLSHKFSVSVKD